MHEVKSAASQPNNEKQWINLISVSSCIAVVFLHTNGCFWMFSKDRYWATANIIECFFYYAVPCFFMITGATLIDFNERYSIGIYFEKRIKKTVIPFVAWSLIGLVYKIITLEISLDEINVQYIWNGVIGTTIIPIYWFFPVLFSVYISIPVLGAVKKEKRKNVYAYAAITAFVIYGIIPLLCNTLFSGFTWNLTIGVASGYLLFILVGYLISEYEMSHKIRVIIYLLAIVGMLMHMIGTYVSSIEAGEVVSTYKGYLNAPCILYSVGIFTWLRYNGNAIMANKYVKKFVDCISPHTLAIYLLQYFIYTALVKALGIDTRSIVYRLGAPFVVVPVAVAFHILIKRIPVAREILP